VTLGSVLPWWILLPAFLVAERAAIEIPVRRRRVALSLFEVPLVIGIVASSPRDVLVAQLAAVLALSAYDRRERPRQVILYTAGRSLQTVVTLALVAAGPSGSLEICLAVAVGAIARSLLITRDATTAAVAAVAALGTGSLTLAGCLATVSRPAPAWLLAPPIVAGALAYRAFSRRVREGERSHRLYEAVRESHSAGGSEAAIAAVLSHAREMFHARIAEVQVLVEDGEVLIGTLGRGDETPSLARVEDSDSRCLTDQLSQPARIIEAARGRGGLERRLRRRGLRSVMLAPLDREGRAGVLVVGNPERSVLRFDPALLESFAAFAAQAGVTLQKDRLQEQFRHLAFHDPLTDLANRALFADRTEQALLRSRRSAGSPAVLLLDLDDFKAVNDRLGHAAGDQLLVQVAERIHACVRPHDTAARLGGDEFAILLEAAQTAGEATGVAERLTAAMQRPFLLEGEELAVRFSIGIALAAAGSTSADLLRRADGAMYRAKRDGKSRWAISEPQPTVTIASA
jgi:diguanylate cyclase (GGDEF)-like protein